MTVRLYFDTETTGIPDRKLPWSHERQPAIVSIAWVRVRDDWTFDGERHALVKPDGWTIDPEGKAFAAHRIPQERCESEGVPIETLLTEFHLAMTDGVDEICAYNIQFDVDMCTIGCEKKSIPWMHWPRRLDIMPLATIYCQLPPTENMVKYGRGHQFKPPKLSEALKIICHEDFPDAHDALADVRATIRIHRALEEFRNGKSAS